MIIIGAGRSGTNMLRDLLCRLPQFVTWPCDEINYIWRHSNRDYATDQFTREMVDAKTAKFIQQRFSDLEKSTEDASIPERTIVEKTCANTLRCGFIHEIFPSALFIHIIRDGRDVASSAALRWNAKLDLNYLMKKARFVPKSDLPFYAWRYLKSRIYKITSGKSRLSTWGPKFDGMEFAFTNHSLVAGCAIQWRECVSSARTQLAQIDSQQVLTLRYEDFTARPASELRSICEFLGNQASDETLAELVKSVSNKSVGKWQSQLSSEEIEEINEVAGPLLAELGYKDHPSSMDCSTL